MEHGHDRHHDGGPTAKPEAVVLETRSVLHIPGAAVPVETVLEFDAADPAAVIVRFDSGRSTTIEWLVSRDLLVDGLTTMAGTGDVVIWPGPDSSDQTCNLRLTSPTGDAVFELSAVHLRLFLQRTFELVPRHCESYGDNLDEELLALLEDRG